MSRRFFLLSLLGAVLFSGSSAAFAAGGHRVSAAAALATLDTDHDGTLDLNEVKTAAEAKFAALDVDHDGTLDRHELSGLLTGVEFASADSDQDKTLDKTEYVALVTSLFEKADRDHDGTLTKAELSTPAGRKLLLLLAY